VSDPLHTPFPTSVEKEAEKTIMSSDFTNVYRYIASATKLLASNSNSNVIMALCHNMQDT